MLTGIALIARSVAAWVVDFAPYTDPAYYSMVAGQLAAGHGFSAPALWSFLEVGGHLPDPAILPVPSNGHWMPLTAIVAAGGIVALGDLLGAWRAAQVPMILLSTALVPVTYLVGWELWRSRRVAIGGALLAILAGPLLLMYPLPDNFAVFGVAGAGALWCATRSVSVPRPGPWLIAAGALVGLASLARVDGLLLAVAPAVAGWIRRGELRGLRGVAWTAGSAVAGLVVLAPWLVRNLAAFGAALPSAGGHTLLITDYNQQFSIGTDPDLASFLAAGLPSLIGARLATWAELIGRTAVLLGGIFVLPFGYGLWAERRRPELRPFVAYFGVMFVVMGAVFTLHAPKGAFYHSSGAWLPFALPLAVAWLPGAATAVGRAWAFLRRPATHRFLLVAGLAGALALALAGSATLLVGWRDANAKLTDAAAFLAGAARPGDRVMAYDPSAVYLLSGRSGVAPPYDDFAVIGSVVEAYDIDWVVITLRPGETTDPLDLWNGAAGIDSRGRHPGFLPAEPAFEAPGVRVFEVSR